MKPFVNYRNSYYIKNRVKNPNIIVGEYSYYSGYHHGEKFEDQVCQLDEADTNGDKLIIGKFCSIGSGVLFLLGGNEGHRYDWISAYPLEALEEGYDVYRSKNPKGYKKGGDTVIGNDVSIGAEVLFMPGVKVGNGVVITTRAVITEDIPSYSMVAGNPGKVTHKRFSGMEIETLEKLAWWNWPIEKIRRALPLLRSNQIHRLAEIT